LGVVGVKRSGPTDREVYRQRTGSDARTRKRVDEVPDTVFRCRARSHCDRHIRVVVGDGSGCGAGRTNIIASAGRDVDYGRLIRLYGAIRARINRKRCGGTADRNRDCAVGAIERRGAAERIVRAR